ncbi:putative ribonuclease H-like domain-containing protein [Tanacetum coccineum]
MTDAKELWVAIKSRFGGNDKSKKMQKYILKQQFEGFLYPTQKGFTKAMTDWTNHLKEDEDYALMACNSLESDTEVTSCSNKCKESYANLKKLYDAQREQLSDASIEIKVILGLKKLKHSSCSSASQLCDNGTEFKNKDVIEFCGSKGIKREYSNARTPQQNGVAERKNKTLIEAARTILADSFLPNTFWVEAVSTSCYVLDFS